MLKQTAPQRSSNSLTFINNVTKQSMAATKALQGSNNPTTITFNNHLKHTQLYSNLTALLVAKDSAISTNWTEPIFCRKAPIIFPSQSRTTTQHLLTWFLQRKLRQSSLCNDPEGEETNTLGTDALAHFALED